jgi:hypothetical protein
MKNSGIEKRVEMNRLVSCRPGADAHIARIAPNPSCAPESVVSEAEG